MSGDVAIRVRGLTTRFGDQLVHDRIDFDVRRGEILGLVGPSGAGKSVMLREIIGLDPPTAGTVEFVPIDGRTPRMGVMFQDGALFSNLTLMENVEVPMKEHTTLHDALRAEIAGVKLVMAGLHPESHHKQPANISGGMRKRAAVARALALDPELLFLDEPTAGLDPISAENFDRLIKELAGALGLTVLIVTHDLDTLSAICDRVAVLYDAKLAAIGPMDEVVANATGWVKEYFSGPRGRAARPQSGARASGS
ncbi:MAG: ATP-binding cassette domain-containing protein [Alphaproteobacteria bacterium]